MLVLAFGAAIDRPCKAVQASAEGAWTATRAHAAQAPQVLRVAYLDGPETLDPHKAFFLEDAGIVTMLFRGLFVTSADGQPLPGVARELPTRENGGLSDDGRILTIRLKDGQRWSDGSPLTARDFEHGLKRVLHPRVNSPNAAFLFSVAGARAYHEAQGGEIDRRRDELGVAALDELTLRITLTEPRPTMPLLLSLWFTSPVKQSVIEAFGPVESSAWAAPGRLVGNGPFVLTRNRDNREIVVEANANYTLTPQPKLDAIEFFAIGPEIGFAAWQAGEIDLTPVPADTVPLVAASPTLSERHLRGPEPTTFALLFQFRTPVLRDVRVRLALAKAIDREAYVREALGGRGEPALLWLHPSVPGAVAGDGDALTYDPADARRLLVAAGYPNGEGFPELELLASDTSVGRAQAAFLVQQFRDTLNITVRSDFQNARDRSRRYVAGEFQLTVGGWREDYHDPENWLPELFATGGSMNRFSHANPEFDDLVRQARATGDDVLRLSLYRRAHQLVLRDAVVAPLYHRVADVLVQSHVRGLVANPQDFGWTGQHGVEQIEIIRE